MKPIDWPRILANPAAFAEHLPRLDERISHWPALCELCVVTGEPLEAFDLGLMVYVRDFFLTVKRREWDMAGAMYQQIVKTRAGLASRPAVPMKTKSQPNKGLALPTS